MLTDLVTIKVKNQINCNDATKFNIIKVRTSFKDLNKSESKTIEWKFSNYMSIITRMEANINLKNFCSKFIICFFHKGFCLDWTTEYSKVLHTRQG